MIRMKIGKATLFNLDLRKLSVHTGVYIWNQQYTVNNIFKSPNLEEKTSIETESRDDIVIISN